MQQCPTCGSQNPDNAEVCADCGMELPKHSAASSTPSSTPLSTSSTTPAPSSSAPTPEATPFDFAHEGSVPHSGGTAPSSTPAPVAATGTDPFGGSNWDFDLDKGQPASPSAPGIQSTPEPAIVPDVPAGSPVGGSVSTPLPDAGTSAPTPVAEPAVVPPSVPAPASSATGGAKLILKRGGALTGDVFPIGPSATVGRFDPESGPVDVDMANLPEAVYISRHHAEVNLRDGQWMVKDLGSRNGTFVKNAAGFNRVTGETALQSGDEVAFGNARFEFQTS